MVSSSLHIDGYQIATKRNSWVSKLNYGNNVAPECLITLRELCAI